MQLYLSVYPPVHPDRFVQISDHEIDTATCETRVVYTISNSATGPSVELIQTPDQRRPPAAPFQIGGMFEKEKPL
jgi:hypothetical protein